MNSVTAPPVEHTPDPFEAFLNCETDTPPIGGSTKVGGPSSEGGQLRFFSKGEERDLQISQLLAEATRSHSRHAPSRTVLRVPALQRHYGPKSSYWSAWKFYLVRLGLRMSNDASTQGIEVPTRAELESVFVDLAFARATTYSSYEGRGRGMSDTAVYSLAASAAETVSSKWYSEWLPERVEAGRLGGERSRRGPSTSADTVGAMLALWPESSHAELARLLDVSVSTIKRRRRELRHVN